MELTIGIGLGQEADAQELDDATRELRRELLELDVEDVEHPSGGAPPEDARAVEAVLLGTLLVKLGQQAVESVVRAVAGWLSRRPDRTVKLQLGEDAIELSDPTDEQQRELIAAFLARNGAGTA